MHTTELRIARPADALFAATFVALGAYGLAKGAFVQPWEPVPKWVPARDALAWLCTLTALASGMGLLVQRSAAAASRILFASLLAWLVVLRLPNLFYETPLVLVGWTFGATAVMVAGAWVLYIELAVEPDRARLGAVADERGLRIARALYGVSLIPFGLAHFMYLDATTVLIPGWLPFHVSWAYFTGAAFIAAGLSTITGVFARLGASLSALQMAMFGLIVWVPRVLTGNLNDFQRGEAITTFVLMAGAFVVADSYRGARWFATR